MCMRALDADLSVETIQHGASDDLRATHNVKQQRAEFRTAFLIPTQAKEAPGGTKTSAPGPFPGSWQQSCSIVAISV